MQRRFLGDAKDSFKWDYHDYVAPELGYARLTVALMMRPDGKKNTHGGMEPEKFPARNCIIGFCNELRGSRDPQRIRDLPQATGAAYRVLLHRGDTLLTKDAQTTSPTSMPTTISWCFLTPTTALSRRSAPSNMCATERWPRCSTR